MSFSGNLEQDSPSLYDLISSRSDIDKVELSETYSKCIQLGGGKEDLNTKRTIGARYNPRPARLCYILWKEGQIRSINALHAAMATTIPIEYLAKSELNTEAATFAEEALQLLRNPSQKVSEISYLIACSLALDELRHLHLQERPTETFLTISNNLIENSPGHSRILDLLSHQLRRCEKALRPGVHT